MYKSFLRPLLFTLSPETAHYVTFSMLRAAMRFGSVERLLRKWYDYADPCLPVEVAGLRFRNPVGLAAGFDKDARLIDQLACFGFGFIEVGTVTPRPQVGNPKPRLFRLPEDKALINRMGFNNEGLEAMKERLRQRASALIIGGNIGKNKDTPNELAAEDFLACFQSLHPVVDYFTVNVSSPNTPGLRDLQEKEPLKSLLQTLQQANQGLKHPKPVFLKIAPDLTQGQLDDILEIASDCSLSGLIATNTTLSREGLQTADSRIQAIGAGGLSGKPLVNSATEVIRYLARQSRGQMPIIGVGGIFSPEDAIEKLEAGATLLQVYTGFVYEGPSMVSNINRHIAKYNRAKKQTACV